MDIVTLRKELTNWAHTGITYTAWATAVLGFVSEIIHSANAQAGLPPSLAGWLVVAGSSVGTASKLIDSLHSLLMARFTPTVIPATTATSSTGSVQPTSTTAQ